MAVFKKVRGVIARPANTTAYAQYDAVGSAFVTFDVDMPGSYLITGCRIIDSTVATTAPQLRLHLFNGTAAPTDTITDNSALSLADETADKRVCTLSLDTAVSLGVNQAYDWFSTPIPVSVLSSGKLYGALQVNNAYAPSANSNTFTIILTLES